MILTLTPNPSIDATVRLNEELEPGAVHRAGSVSSVAGGKGVNVTHAVTLANVDSLALLPAVASDPFLALAADASIPVHAVPAHDAVRTNTTLTEPDGRTTKLNGPGPTLDESIQQDVAQAVAEHCAAAEWIVMAGSLPQGVPTDWYTQLICVAREANPGIRVAVDTSDAPMVALGENLETASPDLIKPNGLELGQLANVDGQALEAAAENGDLAVWSRPRGSSSSAASPRFSSPWVALAQCWSLPMKRGPLLPRRLPCALPWAPVILRSPAISSPAARVPPTRKPCAKRWPTARLPQHSREPRYQPLKN